MNISLSKLRSSTAARTRRQLILAAAVVSAGVGVALPASAYANTSGAACPGGADQSCTVKADVGEGSYTIEFLTQQTHDGPTGTRSVSGTCSTASCPIKETAVLVDGARVYFVNVSGNDVRNVSAS
jgi:hypothetical protein